MPHVIGRYKNKEIGMDSKLKIHPGNRSKGTGQVGTPVQL
jgi:hypothetical protein